MCVLGFCLSLYHVCARTHTTHMTHMTHTSITHTSITQGPSATIKSHHNVGGLPDRMKLKVRACVCVLSARVCFKCVCVKRVCISLTQGDTHLHTHNSLTHTRKHPLIHTHQNSSSSPSASSSRTRCAPSASPSAWTRNPCGGTPSRYVCVYVCV